MFSSNYHSRFPSARGFTLIELLVTIAIIAVLAALLFPAFQAGRAGSDKATALSNMRQIATAIQSYAGENNDYLPGPMNVGQSPRYSNSLSDTLGFRLWSQLGASKPTNSTQEAKMISHPAWERNVVDRTKSPTFALNQKVLDQDGTEQNPWGYNYGGSVGTVPPLTRAMVATFGLSNVWAMQDIDQKNAVSIMGSKPSWFSSLPKTPVHRNVRMVMYFDGHIEPTLVQ